MAASLGHHLPYVQASSQCCLSNHFLAPTSGSSLPCAAKSLREKRNPFVFPLTKIS